MLKNNHKYYFAYNAVKLDSYTQFLVATQGLLVWSVGDLGGKSWGDLRGVLGEILEEFLGDLGGSWEILG